VGWGGAGWGEVGRGGAGCGAGGVQSEVGQAVARVVLVGGAGGRTPIGQAGRLKRTREACGLVRRGRPAAWPCTGPLDGRPNRRPPASPRTTHLTSELLPNARPPWPGRAPAPSGPPLLPREAPSLAAAAAAPRSPPASRAHRRSARRVRLRSRRSLMLAPARSKRLLARSRRAPAHSIVPCSASRMAAGRLLKPAGGRGRLGGDAPREQARRRGTGTRTGTPLGPRRSRRGPRRLQHVRRGAAKAARWPPGRCGVQGAGPRRAAGRAERRWRPTAGLLRPRRCHA
jgi:hypothetical protein